MTDHPGSSDGGPAPSNLQISLLDAPLAVTSRGLTVLLTLASAVIVVAGLRAFGSSIGPLLLALVVVVVVSPVYHWLRRHGMSTLVSTVGLAVTAFGVLFVMIAALVWTVTRLVILLSSDFYTEKISETQASIEDRMAVWGYTRDDLGEAFSGIDLTSVAGQVTSALSSVLSITGAISLILIAMLFMVMDTEPFTRNLDLVAEQRPLVVNGLREFASRTRSYFIVSTAFGLIVAALDGLALVILGIPLPLVWAVLSLITNYIPNVGFVLGLIPPATLAFFEGGWQLSVWVIVIYVAINTIIQSVIQPKFVGDAVGLSTTLTFISLIFWGWVLGPLGALLAVPMTLLSKALLIDIDPTIRWAAPLISLSPERPPPDGDPPGSDGHPAEVAAAELAAAEVEAGEAAETDVTSAGATESDVAHTGDAGGDSARDRIRPVDDGA